MGHVKALASGSGEEVFDSLFPPQDRLLWVCLSFLGFAILFIISWAAFTQWWKKFAVLSTSLKADNCSRVNSTLHSIIVVPALSYGILVMQWGSHLEPLGDPVFLQKTLCITLGYFMCDTVIIVMYQVPLWGLFVAHHIIASTPYVMYEFLSACPDGLFILACFMLVEFSNVSLNTQAFLEQCGLGDSKWYAAAFYTTFFGWIVCRLVNPISMLFVLHMKILPSLPPDRRWCLVPGAICAYLINVFCIGIFVFVLCKEVRLRWTASPDPKEVAHLTEGVRPVDFSTSSIRMTDDERELTIESPTRILIHEAREKMVEIEQSISVQLEKRRAGASLVEHRGRVVKSEVEH